MYTLLTLYHSKDLESSDIPRICLALDTLIQHSSEDAIPAIQSRLQDLLSHNSSVGHLMLGLVYAS